MNTSLIVQEQNIELIIKEAPKSYQENKESHDKCLMRGKDILSQIRQGGMTDELDQSAAEYIERSKKTIKKMLDKRSPVTKLFDEIRSVYTTLENEIDPTKSSSIPAEIQTLRNSYAAKKRAEAEAKRREEERIQRIESAKNSYRISVEEDYRQSFQRLLNETFNKMNTDYNSVTLENYDEKVALFKNYQRTLPDTWIESVSCRAMIPVDLDTDISLSIRKEVKEDLKSKLQEQFAFDIGDNLDNNLLMLPSKKKELEAISKSENKEDAERLRQEMIQREADDAAKVEQERKKREEEEQQSLKVKEQQSELGALFELSASAAPSYQPKAQVKKKIAITSTLGFLDILNLWWTTEGCTLSAEELTKKFKSQITHCEKLANDKTAPRFIQSQHIVYEDEVKAK